MGKYSDTKLSTNEMGILLDLVFFMNKIPGIKVYFERTEFRVHYLDGCHSHLSFGMEDFESLHNGIRHIIKEQHEYNRENHFFYTHEEAKELGLKGFHIFSRHPGKGVSILSRKSLDEYFKKIEKAISQEYKD